MLKKTAYQGLCAAFVYLGLSCGVYGQSIRIGLSTEPTALDPHFHQFTPNIAAAAHIFETLSTPDAEVKIKPGLAESWSLRDDRTWVFNLRRGVKFSNGADFNAQDVIYTFCRNRFNDSPMAGGYEDIVRMMESVTAEDDYTLVIKTKQPHPLLVEDLTLIPILWKGIATYQHLSFDIDHKCGVTSPWPSVADFNSGKVTIGTGPYVFKSFVKGASIELTRNEHYWGGQPTWAAVKLVPLPLSAPRVTALLSGQVDVIENVAGRDVKNLTDKGFLYTRTPSVRVIVLELDSGRSHSPLVSASDGSNPLQNLKVRQALSMAIDRSMIVNRVLDGAGVPAYQFLPDGMFGALGKPPVTPYDPEQAKKLLVEAGYPDGFDLTLTGPNDRYISDAQVLQTIAQYFNRIGVRTKVDTMTRSVFFPKRDALEYSASLIGWASSAGEASEYLRFWVTTRNLQLGLGAQNIVGFSSPEFDKVFLSAVQTMSPAEREPRLQQAMRIAIAQLPQIPLHFESSTWGYRPGLVYEGRRDQRTFAMSVRPSQ